jgi:CelD/BcsL family acetyltransferase involved in cellulose biosynthesis
LERRELYISEIMQEVKIFTRLEIKFESLWVMKEKWENLFKITEYPSPFLSYGWFFALSKHLLKREVEVMVFYDEDKTVGIVPAEIKDHKLSLIGDERVTDLNGFVSNPDYSGRIIESLISFIIEEKLNFEFYPVNEESEIVRLLPGMLKEKTVEKIEPFPVVSLPSSWEDYLAGLSAKKRHELRRKLNRVKGAEIKDLKAAEIEILFELMEYSENKKEFLTGEMKDFFRALALYLEGIDALRLRGIYFNGKILGVIFAFQMGNMVYAFNTGYDPNFYKLSPGFVSFAMDIESAIAEGFIYYNFLRGEERFKFDLGSKRVYTWKVKG